MTNEATEQSHQRRQPSAVKVVDLRIRESPTEDQVRVWVIATTPGSRFSIEDLAGSSLVDFE